MMNVIDLIREQIESVEAWTTMLIEQLPDSQWTLTPEPLKTNINWQVGHMLHDKYFHSIRCIVENAERRIQGIPIKLYQNWYSVGSDPLIKDANRPDKRLLITNLEKVNQLTLQVLNEINIDELQSQTVVSNPVARTKYESLMWCFKHQMWHNGQLAMLKRVTSQLQ